MGVSRTAFLISQFCRQPQVIHSPIRPKLIHLHASCVTRVFDCSLFRCPDPELLPKSLTWLASNSRRCFLFFLFFPLAFPLFSHFFVFPLFLLSLHSLDHWSRCEEPSSLRRGHRQREGWQVKAELMCATPSPCKCDRRNSCVE